MHLKPSDIRFSQDSINNYFDKRSRHSATRIGETLDSLCEGRCLVESIPTIAVVKEGSVWITADNRRLWVFRELERLGKCETIPVMTTFSIPVNKRTSFNGGKTIRVRGSPGGYWHSRPTVYTPTNDIQQNPQHTYRSQSAYNRPNSYMSYQQQYERGQSNFEELNRCFPQASAGTGVGSAYEIPRFEADNSQRASHHTYEAHSARNRTVSQSGMSYQEQYGRGLSEFGASLGRRPQTATGTGAGIGYLSVIQGVGDLSLNRNLFERPKVSELVTRYSYGIGIMEPFIKGIHPDRKKVINEYNKEYCTDYFDKHISRMTIVHIGKSFGKKEYFLADGIDAKIDLEVYRSTTHHPILVDEPGCALHRIFDVDRRYMSFVRDRHIGVEMIYTGPDNLGENLEIIVTTKYTRQVFHTYIATYERN